MSVEERRRYHSVTFGSKNTWDDWHLIPTSRPVIMPPPVKTHMIDIPGGYGSLDLTTSLTNTVLFGQRTGSMEFAVVNEIYGEMIKAPKYWAERYSDIQNYLHGRRCKVVLEDDRYYYYEGRCSINEWKSEESYSLITIDYDLYPFKKEMHNSMESWLWDPFNFESGIIRNYGGNVQWVHGDLNIPGHITAEGQKIRVDGTYTLGIPGSRETVIPEIYAYPDSNKTLKVEYEGETYNLEDSTPPSPDEPPVPNVIYEISIKQLDRDLKFKGNGYITVNYQGGWL